MASRRNSFLGVCDISFVFYKDKQQKAGLNKKCESPELPGFANKPKQHEERYIGDINGSAKY
jgi:hypothetical protein